MVDEPAAPADADQAGTPFEAAPVDVLVEDVLVEEVSIDGMCGVY